MAAIQIDGPAIHAGNEISFFLGWTADTIVMGDLSCLAQINGGLSRRGSPKRARHIADILAEGLVKDEN